MKKKTIIGLIVAGIFLIGVYFGYKGINWFIYNMSGYVDENLQTLYANLNFKDTITIQKEEATEYLEFQNIKVKNVVQNFEKPDYLNTTDDFEKYVLYDENHKVVAAFWLGVTQSKVDSFKSEFDLFGDIGGIDVNITNKDMIAFFKKYNITNDIEMFEYLNKQELKKDNIFTSVKQMRENYIVRNIIPISIPNIDFLTKIVGDRTGYILNIQDKIKEVSILEDDKRYIFTFLEMDYFDDVSIQEILNSIVIENA